MLSLPYAPSLQVEKDEDFIKSVAALGAIAEEVVKTNNAIDIYEDYFAGRQLEQNTEAPYAKTLTVLRDPSASKREAQYLCWHPDGARCACAIWCTSLSCICAATAHCTCFLPQS